MKLLSLLILLFEVTINDRLLAQPLIDWIQCFGGVNQESFRDVYSTTEGDYVMCGVQWDARGVLDQAANIYIVKCDALGELIWDLNIGENNILDRANSVIEIDDGDFIVAGRRGTEICALRVTAEGELIWLNNYGSLECHAVIELKEGDLILAGENREDPNNNLSDGVLVRIRTNGDVVWRRVYLEADFTRIFNGIRETENGVVVAGRRIRRNGVPWDRIGHTFAAKFGFDGDPVWNSNFQPRLRTDYGRTLCSTAGGFVVAGDGQDEQAGRYEFAVRKFNGQGEEVYSESYSLGWGSEMRWLGNCRLSNDDVILAGFSRVENSQRPAVQRLSPDGVERWSTLYSMEERGEFGQGANQFYSVTECLDGGLVACGNINNTPNQTGYDGFLMKLEPLRLEPVLFFAEPTDTFLTILVNDTIQFAVRARSQQGWDVQYTWIADERDTLSSDSMIIRNFNQISNYTIKCIVSTNEFHSSRTWHITVSDLFIARHTPDTLNLTLRRGASQTFTLDSVAATQGDDPIQYLWTLADLTNQQSNEIGEDSSTMVHFVRSGNYAVTGEAYRNDASDVVTWRVAVRGAALDFVPPILDLTVRTDTTLHFEVFAFNPGSDSLSYAWYYGEDLIGLDSAAEVIFGPEEGEYQIRAVVMDGMEGDTVRWQVRTVTPDGIEDCRLKIADWGIKEVWPNPFNSQITIRYQSVNSAKSADRLTIHDISGREVSRLAGDPPFNSPPASKGGKEGNSASKGGKESGIKQGGNSVTQSLSHSVTTTWDASGMPAGVYLIRLQSGSNVAVKKIVLMR